MNPQFRKGFLYVELDQKGQVTHLFYVTEEIPNGSTELPVSQLIRMENGYAVSCVGQRTHFPLSGNHEFVPRFAEATDECIQRIMESWEPYAPMSIREWLKKVAPGCESLERGEFNRMAGIYVRTDL